MSAPTAERSQLLDALRGFALFGVVWSNYAVLSYWIFMDPVAKAALPGSNLDGVLGFFHAVFVDGKFYSIFSLLFGIGFGFFLGKGTEGLTRFYVRILILLLIGWVHLRYLWAGDILFLYALMGLLLPLFRNASDRRLLGLAAALILCPIAVDALVVFTNGEFDPVKPIEAMLAARDAELGYTTIDAMMSVPDGGWKEFLLQNDRTWLFRFEHLVMTNRPPKVLGLFLLGLWVARRKLFVDPAQQSTLLQRVCIGGFVLGLPFNALIWWGYFNLPQMPGAMALVSTAAYALGVVPLAMAFASGFTLLWIHGTWHRRLLVLAPMGRMALTNYLMQSIIGLVLFTGMGLGLGTRSSAVAFEAMALTVFIVQIFWSRWWLQRFRFGPFEWAWRCLTYGKVLPMR